MKALPKIGVIVAQVIVLSCLLVPSFAFAQTTTTATTTTVSSTSATGGTFVPLTQFPQIQALAQSSSFASFVNTVYKICIGAGSVLAVLMIMYAGGLFMAGRGSVSSNEKAKSHLQNAVLGLILVLAPTIVFGIINPDILNLNLGTEFTGLQSSGIDQGAFANPLASTSSPGGSCPANPQAVQGDMCPAGDQPTIQSCCGTTISATAVCCAPKTTTPANSSTAQPQGGEWGWRIKFTGGGSSAGVYDEKGPFSTQQDCSASLTSFIQSNSNLTMTEDQPCTCSSVMSSQSGCHL